MCSLHMAAVGRPLFPVCVFILREIIILYIKFNYKKYWNKKHLKNEQKSRDTAAKMTKRSRDM